MRAASIASTHTRRLATALLVGTGLCGSLQIAAQDADGLNGTYVGNVAQVEPVNGRMEIHSHLELYRFLADGRYCSGFAPDQDLATLDWELQRQATPKLCGHYEINGHALRLTSVAGAAVTETFERSGAALNIAGSLFVKLESANDGALVGSFWRQGGDTASPGGAPVPSAPLGFAFFADGRFELLGAAHAAGGQYVLQQYRLTLHYADGRQASQAFFRYPYEPRTVVIDGTAYARR